MVGDFQEPEKETPPAHPVLPEEFLPPVCESGLMRVVRDVLA